MKVSTDFGTVKVVMLKGEKGDAGENGNFEDLTEDQIAELREDISSVYYRVIESVFATTEASTSTIEIPVDGYTAADMLFINVEGLDLTQGTDYTISGNTITLAEPITHVGTRVNFRVMRAVAVTAEDYDNLKGEKGDTGEVPQTTIGDAFGASYSVTDYHLHQSDFHNDVVKPTIANVFPPAPAGTVMQGMCIDSNGNIYVAYRAASATYSVLRKYTGTLGDGSTLVVADELTLSHGYHVNSINTSFDGTKLLITRISNESPNIIDVIDLSTFTEETPITLPYAGVNTAACANALTEKYIVGHYNAGSWLQLFEYNDDLTRPDLFADCRIKLPVERNFSQGCCVDAHGMYYQLYSYARNGKCETYVLAVDLNDSCYPVCYPVGTGKWHELEDISIYNGHMYSNQSSYLFDLGTDIVNSYSQYATLNWWNPIEINKIGWITNENFADDTNTVKFPKKIELPNAVREIYNREPTRVSFRMRVQEEGHGAYLSPWYKLDFGEFHIPFIYANVHGLWLFQISSISSGVIIFDKVVRVEYSEPANVRTTSNYPSFAFNRVEIEFKVVN